jgi:protein ImuB
VWACDRAAAAAGVGAGQKLSTALGLQPGLAVFERDAALERRTLESLACWAGRFTPTVSLAPPAGLLLEIGGCLRLFGGAPAIVDAVLTGCAEQSYSVAWAAAPTPLAARWLAQAGNGALHPTPMAMQASLADLSCTVPDWPVEVPARLAAFGLRRLGDLAAVPAAGLRRRIGNGPVDDLLRAWGELPDPQMPFVFPEKFAGDLELPARVEHAEALAFAGQRLLAALSGWLHARQLLARTCTLHLTHDDGTCSALPLHPAEASADEGRFLRLLREHLGRLQLAAPVAALRLAADEVVARPSASAHLFDQAPTGEARRPASNACAPGSAKAQSGLSPGKPTTGRNARHANARLPWILPLQGRRPRPEGCVAPGSSTLGVRHSRRRDRCGCCPNHRPWSSGPTARTGAARCNC